MVRTPGTRGTRHEPASAPTLSVIIPAYRAAGTIRRALDSVLRQTRPADEILVIDDGSPDDLAAAVAPYGGRIRFVRQQNRDTPKNAFRLASARRTASHLGSSCLC